MAVSSLSMTRKPLFHVIQMILNDQKRHFKLSVVSRVVKRTLSTQGNSVLLSDPTSPIGVKAASEANQQHKSAPSYGSSDKFPKCEVSNITVNTQSSPGVKSIPMRMQAFSGNTQASQVGKTFDSATSAFALKDLQADLPSQVNLALEENMVGHEETLFPGPLRTSPKGLVDPTTMQQVFYFDTLACMKKLEAKGFTRDQAEACVECLVEIINSTLDHQAKHMITKSQQEIAVQQLLSEIISVKKDMVLLQKSEFSSLRSETEKIGINMNRIETHFQDEVVKLKGQFSLDVNLERGRSIEAHAENEKKLQLLHNKIDMEIANLKTTYEIYRNDVIKFAGGTVLTCATLILGFIRLWK